MSPKSKVARGFLVLASSLLVACGSDTPMGSDPTPPRITVLSRPQVSDTIEAEPPGPYVLAVTNGDGTPVVGATVAFSTQNTRVATPGGPFGSSASLQTDSRGEVAVAIRYGSSVGPGSVVASVPTIQRADTLEVEVEPGAPVGPSITPGDTAVVVGAPFAVVAAPVDRLGNIAGPTVPVSTHGPVSVAGQTAVGTAIGHAQLTATMGDMTVSVDLTVVPDGQVVYTSDEAAWISRFDGSETARLDVTVPPSLEPSISWDSDGSRVVMGGYEGFLVFDLTTGTRSPLAWPGGDAGSTVLWPRFGPDGRIYYTAAARGGEWDQRYANADGSSAGWTIPAGRFPNNDFHLDWAPDGESFIFTADWETQNDYFLRLSDADATVITSLSVEGVTPVWSPDGSLIAYQELGLVGVVSPDETTSRTWNLGWAKGVTWSPDSRLIVGLSETRVAVLDTETGNTVTLLHLPAGVDAVAWRPQ